MSDTLKEKLVDQYISAIYADDERIVFRYGNNEILDMQAIGDCCSRSWIEAVEVTPGALGSRVTDILVDSMEDKEASTEDDCIQVYLTIVRTLRGDIYIEYRNSSNGYYGGYLEERVFKNDLPKLIASIDPDMMLKELI